MSGAGRLLSPLWGGVGGGDAGGARCEPASTSRLCLKLRRRLPHPYPPLKGEGFGRVAPDSSAGTRTA